MSVDISLRPDYHTRGFVDYGQVLYNRTVVGLIFIIKDHSDSRSEFDSIKRLKSHFVWKCYCGCIMGMGGAETDRQSEWYILQKNDLSFPGQRRSISVQSVQFSPDPIVIDRGDWPPPWWGNYIVVEWKCWSDDASSDSQALLIILEAQYWDWDAPKIIFSWIDIYRFFDFFIVGRFTVGDSHYSALS